MDASEREQLLTEELLLIRHAGELPEVALHNSLYALCESADGPCLQLEEQELRRLQEATWNQYQRILLRDLQPANRKRSIFRGLKRAISNWRRLCLFGGKMHPPCKPDPAPIAQALILYLQAEVTDLQLGDYTNTINCSEDELLAFARELHCVDHLPQMWRKLFDTQNTENRCP